MSQINGILHFDGKPTEAESIIRMLKAGEESCPDGSGVWRDRGIALGFSLLQTLPSYRCVSAPFQDAVSGLVIAADARIDNRSELSIALSLGGAKQYSDAEIILLAYRQWNEACVEHLIGDFAFAIWDTRARKLFCARDSFGTKPFYYFHSQQTFIFSSTVLSMLQAGEVSWDLNEEFIADSLAGLTWQGDATVYRDIASLPAAHCLTLLDGKISLRRYWGPDGYQSIQFSREEDYVERFRELFTEAVRCRLETEGEAAALLSGGLDSSSIAAVAGQMLDAKNKRLSTYSFVLADDERRFNQDEKDLVTLLHGMRGLSGNFISSNDFIDAPFQQLYESCKHLPVPHSPYLSTLFDQLRKKRTRVLLDGGGGDLCVTCESPPPLHEFLSGLQFGRLINYVRAASGVNTISVPFVIIKRLLADHLSRVGNHEMADVVLSRSVLSERFRDRMQIMERAKRNLRYQPARSWSLREIMRQRLLLTEKAFRVTELFSLSQVEVRNPMLDRRLVDYCLSVPAEQHSYDMNRRLIRRAMQGLLPDEVRLRHNKDIPAMPGAVDSIFKHRDYFLATIDKAEAVSLVAEYVDAGKLKKRFTEALPEAVNKGKEGVFMPGPTMRGFVMLNFLMGHASASRNIISPTRYA